VRLPASARAVGLPALLAEHDEGAAHHAQAGVEEHPEQAVQGAFEPSELLAQGGRVESGRWFRHGSRLYREQGPGLEGPGILPLY